MCKGSQLMTTPLGVSSLQEVQLQKSTGITKPNLLASVLSPQRKQKNSSLLRVPVEVLSRLQMTWFSA